MSIASANSSAMEQDDFGLVPKKFKRNLKGQKRRAESPATTADQERPEKQIKTEPALTVLVKAETAVAASPKVKEEKDSDAPMRPELPEEFNPLVHTPKCQHCGTENSFTENDESALVCKECSTVASAPELRRGYDTEFGVNAKREDAQLKREVRNPSGCVVWLLFQGLDPSGCVRKSWEKSASARTRSRESRKPSRKSPASGRNDRFSLGNHHHRRPQSSLGSTTTSNPTGDETNSSSVPSSCGPATTTTAAFPSRQPPRC